MEDQVADAHTPIYTQALEPSPAPKPRRHKRTLGTGLIALAALVIMAVIFDLSVIEHHSTNDVPGVEVAQLIGERLQTISNLSSAPQIRCPNLPAATGSHVICDEKLGSADIKLIVVKQQGTGQFSWSQLHNNS